MTDYYQALTNIEGSLNTILTPLQDDGTVEDLFFSEKSKGTPGLPFLNILFFPTTIDMTTIGSIGNNESWILDLRIRAVVKEIESPMNGVRAAADIVSKARNLILTNRQLNLPNLVRKVDSKSIEIVPYPINKKKTLYGAGAQFNVHFVINNITD